MTPKGLQIQGFMSAKLKQSTIQELPAIQKADGGCSLPMLGDWVGSDERTNDRNASSDGYALRLVIYFPR